MVDLRDCDIVCSYDPARSRESEFGRTARNAIVTTACDHRYNVYVLSYWALRCSFEQIYDELWRHVDQFHPRCIGIEDVATQMTIGSAFDKLSQYEKRHLPPIEPLRPDTRVNKKWRIRTTIQQVAAYGRLFVLDNAYELETEWNAFPNGRTVDILDTLAYCIQLHAIPLDAAMTQDHNNRMRQAHSQAKGVDHASVIDIRDYQPKLPPADLPSIRELQRIFCPQP